MFSVITACLYLSGKASTQGAEQRQHGCVWRLNGVSGNALCTQTRKMYHGNEVRTKVQQTTNLCHLPFQHAELRLRGCELVVNGRHASLCLFLRPVESSDLALLLRERHLCTTCFYGVPSGKTLYTMLVSR